MPLRRLRPFKVIEVGANRTPICDFLLVINSNWHPISHRFEVIAAYCLHFGNVAFLAPFGGLRDNVRCSSWAHWEAHRGLPISVNWTFFARCYGWVATSEKRRTEGQIDGQTDRILIARSRLHSMQRGKNCIHFLNSVTLQPKTNRSVALSKRRSSEIQEWPCKSGSRIDNLYLLTRPIGLQRNRTRW